MPVASAVKNPRMPRTLPRLCCTGWLLTLFAIAPGPVGAQAADRHEGVASCAGGTCHGATRPLGEHGIRQDEYFIWQQRDPHSRAPATLSGALSRRIGQRLGIDPTTDRQCLACHADAAAPEQRGERWLAGDGIGCETCHGGSQRWLAAHTQPGLTPERRIELGMTATWDAPVRARLCQSCHQGDAAHPISHAMMAAGHPPLLFELDTFAALQPAHYDFDADYVARKGVQDPARHWAVGQAMAADRLLQSLEDGRAGHGLFPELVLFDCDACHRPMSAGRERAGRNAATAAGTPPLADGPFHWLGLWLDVAAPDLAAEWQRRTAALQTATGAGPEALLPAARTLRQLLAHQVLPRVTAQALDAAKLQALLQRLAALDSSVRAGDFLVAEQAAMAAQVLNAALLQRGQPATPERRAAIDALYRSVQRRETFQPAAYHAALQRLRQSLR